MIDQPNIPSTSSQDVVGVAGDAVLSNDAAPRQRLTLPDEKGSLADAARAGRIDVVKQLLDKGVDPMSDESLALQTAADHGHLEIVRLLLPVSDPKAARSLALQLAAKNGHLEIVKLLLPVSDPKTSDSYALREAAKRGYLEIAKLLLPFSDIDKVMLDLALDKTGTNGFGLLLSCLPASEVRRLMDNHPRIALRTLRVDTAAFIGSADSIKEAIVNKILRSLYGRSQSLDSDISRVLSERNQTNSQPIGAVGFVGLPGAEDNGVLRAASMEAAALLDLNFLVNPTEPVTKDDFAFISMGVSTTPSSPSMPSESKEAKATSLTVTEDRLLKDYEASVAIIQRSAGGTLVFDNITAASPAIVSVATKLLEEQAGDNRLKGLFACVTGATNSPQPPLSPDVKAYMRGVGYRSHGRAKVIMLGLDANAIEKIRTYGTPRTIARASLDFNIRLRKAGLWIKRPTIVSAAHHEANSLKEFTDSINEQMDRVFKIVAGVFSIFHHKLSKTSNEDMVNETIRDFAHHAHVYFDRDVASSLQDFLVAINDQASAAAKILVGEGGTVAQALAGAEKVAQGSGSSPLYKLGDVFGDRTAIHESSDPSPASAWHEFGNALFATAMVNRTVAFIKKNGTTSLDRAIASFGDGLSMMDHSQGYVVKSLIEQLQASVPSMNLEIYSSNADKAISLAPRYRERIYATLANNPGIPDDETGLKLIRQIVQVHEGRVENHASGQAGPS